MKALIPLLTLVAILSQPLAASAQQKTAPQLAEEGTAALVAGDADGAIKLLEEFVQKYKNSPLLYSVYLQLGYAYLMKENYDKALDNARKADIISANPAIQELSAALVPELLAAKAGETENEAQRKKLLEEAIAAYAKFVERFPEGQDVETALFGKGIAEMQSEKFGDAIQTLDTFIRQFQQSDFLVDGRYYSALARLAEANEKVTAGLDTTNQDQINQLLDQAAVMFGVIANDPNDVALANDAQMQLGDVYSVKARAASEEERPSILDQAIDAYQKVEASEPLIEKQRARIVALEQQRPNVVRDQRLRRRLEKLIAREQQKLKNLQEGTDSILMAKTKIAELLFQTDQMDAARVLFRYLLPFAEKDDAKKTALYHIALTYARQKNRPKAEEAYAEFNKSYRGDPAADNLPLVVGSLFLENEPIDPERALTYFNDSLEIYPEGNFAALSTVQKASALKMLGRRDEAAKAFDQYLKTQPKGIGAAQAQLGIANIDRDEGRIQKAFDRYQNIRKEFPDTPEAEESSFWIGAILLATQKFEEAMTEFTNFREKYPNSVLTPEVISRMGDASRALGNNEAALDYYAELLESFPDTELAAVARLKRASIYQAANELEKVDEELIAFASEYPEHPNVYIAYKTRSDIQLASKELDAAAEIMQEYVDKYPSHDNTAFALKDLAGLRMRQSEAVGTYISLGAADREKWVTYKEQAAAAAEDLIAKFPDGQQAGFALSTLVEVQENKIDAGIQEKEAIETYFNELIEKNQDNLIASNKLTFTLASVLFPTDPAKALQKMDEVFNPDFIYSARNLDLYGVALLEQNKTGKAKAVYEKILQDFPNKGDDPKKEPRDIQEAQAIAMFGLGKVAEQEQDRATMQKMFDQILALYPWSDKAAEAKLYVAQRLFVEGDLKEARKLLGEVFKTMTTPPSVRAEALLVTAQIFEKENKLEDAVDTYLKVAVFFPSIDQAAAQGLFRGGELLTILATRADETKKADFYKKAAKAFQDLIDKYPDSDLVDKAKQEKATLPKTED